MTASPIIRRGAGAVVAIGAGTGFGYLLMNPVIFFPMDWVGRLLMPLLVATKNHVENAAVADLVQMSILVFTRNFPNTVMVGAVTVAVLRMLGRQRLVLYSVLIWPLLLYLAYWLQVLRLKAGALRLGLPIDIEYLPVPPGFRYTAIFILLTLSFYLAGVLFVQGWLEQGKRNAIAQADEAAD